MNDWITPPPGMQYAPPEPTPPTVPFVTLNVLYRRRDGALVIARPCYDDDRADAAGKLGDTKFYVSRATGLYREGEQHHFDLVELVINGEETTLCDPAILPLRGDRLYLNRKGEKLNSMEAGVNLMTGRRYSNYFDEADIIAEYDPQAEQRRTREEQHAADTNFINMVMYFWRENQDPTRYDLWDEAKCEQLIPEFHRQWKKYLKAKRKLNEQASLHHC